MNDPARLAIARDMLRAQRSQLLAVHGSARLRYAICLLLADDDGIITVAVVDDADDHVIGVARRLLLEADLLPEIASIN